MSPIHIKNIPTKKILILVVVSFILVTAFGVYSLFKAQKNREGEGKLFVVLEKIQKTPAQAAPHLKELEEIAQKFDGTIASHQALMTAGDIYFEGKNYAKAVLSYEQAAKEAPSRKFQILALYNLGITKENQKDYSGALASFENALRLGDKFFKPDLLLAIARSHGLAGNKDKAKEKLELVISEFANTTHAKKAAFLKSNLNLFENTPDKNVKNDTKNDTAKL